MITGPRFRFADARRRHGRLAMGAIAGVFATAGLLLGMASMAGRFISAPPRPVPQLERLAVIQDRPAPPPPPDAAEPAVSPPDLPLLPEVSTNLALPHTALHLPVLELPAVVTALDPVITIEALALPAAQAGPALPAVTSLARPAQREFVPDLANFYPRRLIRHMVEGQTRARLHINAAGMVEIVEILASEPPGVFDAATRKALRTFRYQPAHNANGEAIPSVREETLQWTIAR